MESMTPEAGRRNNWTKVSTIPWYEWAERPLLPPACATEGGFPSNTAQWIESPIGGKLENDCSLIGWLTQ